MCQIGILMNLHIWHNESNYRKGIKDGNNLELTHGLNGIRNTAKNKIQEVVKAVIFKEEKFLLQLRDNIPAIPYPNSWPFLRC